MAVSIEMALALGGLSREQLYALKDALPVDLNIITKDRGILILNKIETRYTTLDSGVKDFLAHIQPIIDRIDIRKSALIASVHGEDGVASVSIRNFADLNTLGMRLDINLRTI